MSIKLKTLDVADQRIDIEVESSGKFSAVVGDETYYGATLEELTTKVEKAAKKLRDGKAVPVTVVNMIPKPKDSKNYYDAGPFVDGIGVIHGVLRGRSERGGDWLLAEGDKGKGPKFKLGGYRSHQRIVRRLTDEEVAQYLDLAHAVAAAEKALHDFTEAVAIDPKEALGLE